MTLNIVDKTLRLTQLSLINKRETKKRRNRSKTNCLHLKHVVPTLDIAHTVIFVFLKTI